MPTAAEWCDDYCTGVPDIDHQHQYFLLLIRRFEKMIHQQRSHAHLLGAIDELIKYTAFHFKSEENLMDYNGFPDLFQHKLSHLDLLDKLKAENLKFMRSDHDPRELVTFLVDWFVDHTVGEDLKFKAYLNDEGITLTEDAHSG